MFNFQNDATALLLLFEQEESTPRPSETWVDENGDPWVDENGEPWTT
jgi:hypothetical protein